jgi:hypothetical protein
VTFNEDRSRLRTGHGAKNMAVIRHFALNLVRRVDDKRPIKRRRKRAFWDPQYLLEILGRGDVNLDSLPWRISDLSRLPRILDLSKMIEQQTQPRLG